MIVERFRSLGKGLKRVCAGLLITSVACTATGIGTIFVEADDIRTEQTLEIADFQELPEDIAYQELPVGSYESDIEFPTSLVVTVRTIEREIVTEDSSEVRIEGGDEDSDNGKALANQK